jgi:hypothetical protein
LNDWGVELPILTDDQKQELRILICEMVEDGSSRDEIKKEIVGKLNDWGVELPILTDDQKQELKTLVREFIKENVKEIFDKLNEYGVNCHRLNMIRRIIKRRFIGFRWMKLCCLD